MQDLRDRHDKLQRHYGARFGGYDRATRDLGELDVLIDEMRQVVVDARGLAHSAEAAELLESAQSRLAGWEREREAIAKAQAAPEAHKRAMAHGRRANRIFHGYRRHFAGQSRRTRDLGLLADFIDQLREIQAALRAALDEDGVERDAVESDLATVTRNIEMYVRERGEIVGSRSSGSDAEADLLAELANLQFDAYRIHFAGHNRLTRRPALLRRIVDNLTTIRDRMRDLRRSGIADEAHIRNIRLVSEQIAMYQTEAEAVDAARAGATVLDRVDAYRQELDRISAAYRENFAGKSRGTRDLTLMRDLLDRAFEIERQLAQIQSTTNLNRNEEHLRAARDLLTLYGREYDAIKKAKEEQNDAKT
jgi:hypothetical protein